MRIGMTALIAGALFGVHAASASVGGTENTHTKTQENTNIAFLAQSARLVGFTGEGVGDAMSDEEMKQRDYERIMKRWEGKQSHLAKSLSADPFIVNASAYTAAADECGKSDGITASGVKVTENRTLACPANYPFGTKIAIEGMGVYTCEDRGGAIKGNHIDIYMETKTQAFAFGRRNLVAQVVY